MLIEHPHVRQVPGETRRRWFTSEGLDLIVWQQEGGPMSGFQLTYETSPDEVRVLTWRRGKGYSHERLDDGEGRVFSYKMSPILTPEGVFDSHRLLEIFLPEASSLDPELARELIGLIEDYG